ncbi:MAG: TlyA family RNA methyltransferase [Candidatus Tectomicrobia bacterium]|nr:TlyA family RNA methyltransferase [Candidatus Tectomicrobia bacterium]
MKERLDTLLVTRGLVESRERARRLIMSGNVFINGSLIEKVGSRVPLDCDVAIKENPLRYVSRGGIKLEKALESFQADVRGKVALDVGASTGGFTDCLLQHGAKRVYAVDVGYGQLAWKLRQDPRVITLERNNIRFLSLSEIPEKIDLATIDVAFISLELVLPVVKQFLGDNGEIIALIKPQFEVGKGEVGKGGVVRDREKHRQVIIKLIEKARALGLTIKGLIRSPLEGPKGNREFFIHLIPTPALLHEGGGDHASFLPCGGRLGWGDLEAGQNLMSSVLKELIDEAIQ